MPRLTNAALRKRANTMLGQPLTMFHGEVVILAERQLSKAGHRVLVRRASGKTEAVSVTSLVNLNPEGFREDARADMRRNGQTGWTEPCGCRPPGTSRNCAYCGVTSHSNGKVCGQCFEGGIDGAGIIAGTARRICEKHKAEAR